MTASKLFIPTKLKVGFRYRQDTFTKKLAYVIYYDAKGVLRKETSWENWRDKSIEPIEVDNIPHSGFILNKDVQRYSWSHYSSGRSMIRVYDDRGIEIEITPTNLLFILMNTNCYKRELEGKFVYAWDDKELVLLPIGCEEYKSSTEFTELQRGKLTIKDMIPGCVYKSKKDVNLIYLGRFLWFDYSDKRNYFSERRYVFVREDYGHKPFSKVSPISNTSLNDIALQVSDSPVDIYAEKLEELSKSKYCSNPIGLLTEELSEDYINTGWKFIGCKKGDQTFEIFTVYQNEVWDHSKKVYVKNGYKLSPVCNIEFKDGKLHKSKHDYTYNTYGYHDNKPHVYTAQEILDQYVRVNVELENGLKVNYNEY